MNEQERRAKLLEGFEKIQKANREGYAGITSSGTLVDRREVPNGWPVATNSMFNITPPRCIQCGQETPTHLLSISLCPECRKGKK